MCAEYLWEYYNLHQPMQPEAETDHWYAALQVSSFYATEIW